ncbi:MAG: transcriptional regulator [Oscillospiraceae bacterium]|jgi:predicted transcriptional regulator|nr:transcriptional regulator [Oscillospiraceae bacterium]
MSKKQCEKGLNELAWEKIFAKYDILKQIEALGCFQISATQIKPFREPRLMAKFDHIINLPEIFSAHKLAILPITRGDYLISHFDAYHHFEPETTEIVRASLPTYIQSLDYGNISSEAMALNCAVAAGILRDFLEEDEFVPTVSGRMGSGDFTFDIANSMYGTLNHVTVHNSQIEIDAAYEGIGSLAIFEAKRDVSEDFLVRQLYYPYRVWSSRVTKPVRPIFLVYSNGVYHLYEYCFQDPNNYSSLVLLKQKNYSVEDTTITVADIQSVLYTTEAGAEPAVSFPQADTFSRVINLCELLSEREYDRNKVTEKYAFDVRQTNYYTDAGRYLGLIHKNEEKRMPSYSLTKLGKQILQCSFKQRQLAYCKQILSHQVFHLTLEKYFENGVMPSKDEIVRIMKQCNLYHIGKDSTFGRRASTIRSWVNWMVELIND